MLQANFIMKNMKLQKFQRIVCGEKHCTEYFLEEHIPGYNFIKGKERVKFVLHNKPPESASAESI